MRRAWWWRLWPRHTIWPTRDGWWCLAVALGLGLAAVNTGNNLVYLLASMLLALIVISGVLSEETLRGLELEAAVPPEIHAGRAVVMSARVSNRKRWLASHAVTLDVLGAGGVTRRIHLPRLAAGTDRLVTWDATFPARGRQRLPGVRVTTRFPFGLFVKRRGVELTGEVLVYPPVDRVPADRIIEAGGSGSAAPRRLGRGHDLRNLRAYRHEDDPRLIHWRVSAKVDALMVRELEAETALDTRIVLGESADGDAARLERGLGEAASLGVHLVRNGALVELAGPGLRVPAGRGRAQETRLLTALALYEPPAAWLWPGRPPGPSPRGLREVRVRLG